MSSWSLDADSLVGVEDALRRHCPVHDCPDHTESPDNACQRYKESAKRSASDRDNDELFKLGWNYPTPCLCDNEDETSATAWGNIVDRYKGMRDESRQKKQKSREEREALRTSKSEQTRRMKADRKALQMLDLHERQSLMWMQEERANAARMERENASHIHVELSNGKVI